MSTILVIFCDISSVPARLPCDRWRRSLVAHFRSTMDLPTVGVQELYWDEFSRIWGRSSPLINRCTVLLSIRSQHNVHFGDPRTGFCKNGEKCSCAFSAVKSRSESCLQRPGSAFYDFMDPVFSNYVAHKDLCSITRVKRHWCFA